MLWIGCSQWATSTAPSWSRAALIGLGWGLPFGSYELAYWTLDGTLNALSLPLVLMVALGHGLVMASWQSKMLSR